MVRRRVEDVGKTVDRGHEAERGTAVKGEDSEGDLVVEEDLVVDAVRAWEISTGGGG